MSESIRLRKIQEKGITRQQEGVRGRHCIKGCRIVWHEAEDWGGDAIKYAGEPVKEKSVGRTEVLNVVKCLWDLA